jgi:D-alanine-D-alanine ligase
MTAMIVLIYNQPIEPGLANWESSADVMAQVEAIEQSLIDLGRPVTRIPVSRNLKRFLQDIEDADIQAAFNLCESLDDDPFFIAHPAAVLELLGIPFTGASSAALQTTTNKQVTKLLLRGAGLPTPASVLYDGTLVADPPQLRFPVIIKPRDQDASIGIDQDSIIDSAADLPDALLTFFKNYGPLLVEEYIDGREFNVSLLGYPAPEVMPVAEIDFSSMPQHLHHIVGYRAKWEPDSVEYRQTKRVFPPLEHTLTARLQDLSRRCFQLFGLRDYGRVDLRMGTDGSLYVLEINANPCLSPDAGFPAAVGRAGLDYTAMVAKMTSFLGDRMV